MSEWNSEQYLKFKTQRTQPAIDLVKRIEIKDPRTILDVGCGPGNSTKVLKDAFPKAHILGIDSSENMIKKARDTYSDIEFKVMDITEGEKNLKNIDVIFSNACLQWIPDHKKLIPMLFDRLSKGGVLAVQIPMNYQEKLFRIVSETVKEDKWAFSPMGSEPDTLKCEEYFDILSSLTDHFDIWETVYYHNMLSVNSMVEWIKGTRLRPYMDALNGSDAEELVNEISKKASEAYTKQENGEIIFKFRRFFFTATRQF